MVSAFRSPPVALSAGALQPLAALQSPYCQRRLSGFRQELVTLSVPSAVVSVKASASSTHATPVSQWLAPYGALAVPCNGLRPVVPTGNTRFTFGSRSRPLKANPARRFTAAASCFSAASRGLALSRLESATPRPGLAPTRQSTRTLRDEAAQRRLLLRWGSPS
jgi:hypothetical protein